MAKMEIQCPACQKIMEAIVAQTIQHNQLTWFSSTRCSHCGFALEGDGFGDAIPDDLRKAILSDEGEWGLMIKNTPSRVAVLKILRAELNLSLDNLKELQQKLPGIVTTGTKMEMTWLQHVISKEDVQVEIIKI